MQQVWLQVAVGWSVGILSVRIGPTFYDPQIGNAKTKAARLRIIATKTHLEILKYRNKTPLINDNDHHRSDYLVHFSSILIHFLLCEAPSKSPAPADHVGRPVLDWPRGVCTKGTLRACCFPADAQSLPSNPQCCWWWIHSYDLLWFTGWLIYIYNYIYMSSTAQGGGGSFKNRKPIGEVGCCESGMAERSHWWIERCLISLSLFFFLFIYLSIYRSISIYLCIYLSIYPSIYRSIYLSN